ncbi:hypothetical protein ACLOJK_034563 [Asimina triloba]
MAAAGGGAVAGPSRQFKLAKESELRIEVGAETSLRLRLLSGTAETFGTELPPENWLTFPPRHKFAIFTWNGATIEVNGTSEVEYVADETPMVSYVNVHAVLDGRRALAKASSADGVDSSQNPSMVSGPQDWPAMDGIPAHGKQIHHLEQDVTQFLQQSVKPSMWEECLGPEIPLGFGVADPAGQQSWLDYSHCQGHGCRSSASGENRGDLFDGRLAWLQQDSLQGSDALSNGKNTTMPDEKIGLHQGAWLHHRRQQSQPAPRMVDEERLDCILAVVINLDYQFENLWNFTKSFDSQMQPQDFMAKDSRCNREATIEVVEDGIDIDLHKWEFPTRIKTIDSDDHGEVTESRGILVDANWKVVESITGSAATTEREGVASLCGHFTGEEVFVLGTDQPTIPSTATVVEDSRCDREATFEAIKEGIDIDLCINGITESRGILVDANWKVVESITGSAATTEREGVASLCGHFTGEEVFVLGTDQPSIPSTATVVEGALAIFLRKSIGVDITTSDFDDKEIDENTAYGCGINGLPVLPHIRHSWGDPFPTADPDWDLIIASDILLYVKQYPNLIKTLSFLPTFRARWISKGCIYEGPRVMVVGPTDSGKSSLAKMLLSWASKQGWKPTFVDLDIGQGSITVPGCIAATPIEMPIDPVEGIPLEMPIVYFFGHTTPSINADLYKVLAKELAQTLDRQFAGNSEARAAGMVINTMGWVEGVGYELLLHAIDVFNANVILVLGQEKLCSMLKDVLKNKSNVDIVKLHKSGGVVPRNTKFRQKARSYRIRDNNKGSKAIGMDSKSQDGRLLAIMAEEYFYGLANDLSPHSNVVNFSDVSVYKIGGGPQAPRSALPIGAEPAADPTRLVPVNINRDLLHLVLAVSYAKEPDQVISSNVAGFIYITDIDIQR